MKSLMFSFIYCNEKLFHLQCEKVLTQHLQVIKFIQVEELNGFKFLHLSALTPSGGGRAYLP